MPVQWTFRCYCSRKGTDEIRVWHDKQSKQVQAKFLSRIKILAQLPFDEWNENYYKDLHGDCAELGEIRFFADKVQQRPLGFRSGKNEFTILFNAKEKGGKFVPKSACKKALARKSEVLKSKDRTNAIWLILG